MKKAWHILYSVFTWILMITAFAVMVFTVISVTYMDRGSVYHVDYVSKDTAYTIGTDTVPKRTESAFKGWVNAGGTIVSGNAIPAGNTENYVFYDSWHSVYTARFVDQQGNVIYEEEFSTSQTNLKHVPDVPAVAGGFKGKWETYDLKKAVGNISIKPIYDATDGIISH